ncbi:MAG: DUF4350 domain-containing protein [Saprospiraceae bacterium]|nr:DUF4350 domain-containing protein [Saprospiraceae bacterium]
MSTRQFLLVGLSGLTIVALLIFTLFDLKDIPDLQWQEHYYLNSKQPYGTWIFHEMIRQRYRDIPVVRNIQDTTLNVVNSGKTLYVYIGDYATFDEFETAELLDFAERGNDLLIIAGSFDVTMDEDEPFLWDPEGIYDSTVTIIYPGDSAIVHSFTYYHESLNRPALKYFGALSEDLWNDDEHTIYGLTSDSLILFDQWTLGGGRVFLHTIPAMFSNLAAKQPNYRTHFNLIFDQFEPDLVILDHISLHRGSIPSESPLQFILGEKSLRMAYFLLLFAAFSFIIFKSKRRQRVIPTRESNVNTSLEYVRTLSDLFLQQKQHKKLIKHLEDIFNHHLRKRYFLDRHDENFIPNLVRKSKVDHGEIVALLEEFDRAYKKLNVGDEHLVLLNQLLDSFYKKCK